VTAELLVIMGSALWLGIQTSISPCPLASNIAAISYISKNVGSPRAVALTGVLYALGRSLVYVFLGAALVWSLLSAPALSHFLQRDMNRILGPLLILTGMVLLGLIPLRLPGGGLGDELGKRVAARGVWGGFLLGGLFALTFCPISAALFFGSLVPLAVKGHSPFLLPALYGIGTALPVLVFAVLIAAGAHAVASAFGRIQQFERWARLATGVLFVGIGLYFSLSTVWGVL
jgi:cytochrome c biogenesis protein CcdA